MPACREKVTHYHPQLLLPQGWASLQLLAVAPENPAARKGADALKVETRRNKPWNPCSPETRSPSLVPLFGQDSPFWGLPTARCREPTSPGHCPAEGRRSESPGPRVSRVQKTWRCEGEADGRGKDHPEMPPGHPIRSPPFSLTPENFCHSTLGGARPGPGPIHHPGSLASDPPPRGAPALDGASTAGESARAAATYGCWGRWRAG